MGKRPGINDINSTPGLVGLGPIPGLAPVAAFNASQIESLLVTKGISAIHYKHAPNPDKETVAGPVNPNTVEAKWGWRFFEARPLKVVPQNFALEHRLNVQGIWGLHTVLLNVSGYYTDTPPGEDKETVFCRPHDIIMLDKTPSGEAVTVETDQIAEYNPTGPLQLNFRVESVRYLADRHVQYICDQDFHVDDGKIYWLNEGRRPHFKNGKGAILSVVYYTKPIFIVKNVPHAIRILPSNSIGHGGLPRKAEYAPQLVIGQQSWIRADNQELLNFSDLPSYPAYRDSKNTTGGTF